MKITVILLTAGCLQLSASALSQQITATFKQAPLEQVMHEIGRQSQYNFIYDADYLSNAAPVTVKFRKTMLTDALKEIFTVQPLVYEIDGDAIYIRPAAIDKHASYLIRNVLQQRTYTGLVADETGSAIPGATIQVKDKNSATVSDEKGRFSVPANPGDVLLITSVGYTNREESLGTRADLGVIRLQQRTSDLDEVIVIGYGTVRRGDLTGSIGEVSVADMAKAPVASFDQALAGRIAGVQVSSDEGDPGAPMNIVIRGGNSLTQSNSPLYVVDGFPIEDFDVASLSPENIASINVLKDASATAIYGARGANGVVVIETKMGKEGHPVISYGASVGLQSELKRMEMMSPYEFVRLQAEINPVGVAETYFRDGRTLESYRDVAGIDWQDRLLRQGATQIHTLALRGGTRATKYAVSGSLFDQDGVIINTGYKRYQSELGLQQQVGKKLTANVKLNYSHALSYGKQPSSADNLASSYLMYATWAYRPITGGNDMDLLEELTDDEANDYRINPIMSVQNEIRQMGRTNILANANINYKFNDNFSLKVVGGINNLGIKNEEFHNSRTQRGNPIISYNSQGVQGGMNLSERFIWSNENMLTYKKNFSRVSRLDVMGGFSLQAINSKNNGYYSVHIPNEELGLSGMDEGTPSQVISSKSTATLASYFGRVNYILKDKYLFTGTFRADGSSKFPSVNRWGYFPSAAFAWRMSEEDFIRNIRAVNDAKLRISYGVTGNNRVSDFAYLPALQLPISSSYSFNNATPEKGANLTGMGNDRLKWESTVQYNIGYDLSLFNSRISITADAYHKTTSDLLLNAQLPYLTGYASAFKNVGRISNRGLELSLHTVNVRRGSFAWESSFNISFNRNKVLALTDNQERLLSSVSWTSNYNNSFLYIAEVGWPAGRFYGYLSDGIYQFSDFNETSPGVYVLKDEVPANGNTRQSIQPGDAKYVDMDGDGTVNDVDQTVIGNGLPKHIGGFNNNLQYKGFSLNLFFQWSYGNDIYNANRLYFEGNNGGTNINQFAVYADRWTPDNPSNTMIRGRGFGPNGYYPSRVVEDGSYLRLKTASLGYTIPGTYIQRIGISSIQVSVTAQNLLTWTNYSGIDPEVSVRHTTLTPGLDWSAYPRARTVVFDLKLTL